MPVVIKIMRNSTLQKLGVSSVDCLVVEDSIIGLQVDIDTLIFSFSFFGWNVRQMVYHGNSSYSICIYQYLHINAV